jgi:5'-3' exonuclease
LPSYKAHRVAAELPGPKVDIEVVPDPLEVQVPVILEVLDAVGLCVVGADGYEADDVIGTLATGAPMPVDVVTGDRDLFQLVDDAADVRVLYIARGVGNHEVVVGKYRVLPSQYADFATLRGDTSDGLPGVAGIGEKTAASLLLSYGDLQGIVDAASDPSSDMSPGPRRKILDAADYLSVAPRVVAVTRDLELAPYDATLPSAPRDPDRLADLAERYNLGSPVERLRSALAR